MLLPLFINIDSFFPDISIKDAVPSRKNPFPSIFLLNEKKLFFFPKASEVENKQVWKNS